MSEPIKIRCPNLLCRVILSVPRDMRGECIRCANCGETLKVPSPSSTPASDSIPVMPMAGASKTK